MTLQPEHASLSKFRVRSQLALGSSAPSCSGSLQRSIPVREESEYCFIFKTSTLSRQEGPVGSSLGTYSGVSPENNLRVSRSISCHPVWKSMLEMFSM
jgi:hypothetical protein